MARPQMLDVANASDAAGGFHLHDPLLEQALSTTRENDCFSLRLKESMVRLDAIKLVLFPLD